MQNRLRQLLREEWEGTQESVQEFDAAVAAVRDSRLAEVACAALGRSLLSVSLRETKSDDGEQESERRRWNVLFLLSEARVTRDDVTAFLREPSPFRSDGAASCLDGDLRLHKLWLCGQGDRRRSSLAGLFQQVQQALRRSDLDGYVRRALEQHLFTYGTTEASFVDGFGRSFDEVEIGGSQLRDTLQRALKERSEAYRRAHITSVLASVQTDLVSDDRLQEGITSTTMDVGDLRTKLLAGDSESVILDLTRGRVFDRGILARLDAASRQAALVRKKFEQYVVGYAVCGSWATRAEEVTRESDVDVLLLINDVDIQSTPREAVRARIEASVGALGREAAQEAGAYGALHTLTYLLTDALADHADGNVLLWSLLEDALILSDPLNYLRGWQSLLKEKRLGPSASYIEMLLDSARSYLARCEDRAREMISRDLYPAVLAAAQSLLLRLGHRSLAPSAVPRLLRAWAAESFRSPDEAAPIERAASILQELYGQCRRLKVDPVRSPSRDILARLISDASDAVGVLERQCQQAGPVHVALTSVQGVPRGDA